MAFPVALQLQASPSKLLRWAGTPHSPEGNVHPEV